MIRRALKDSIAYTLSAAITRGLVVLQVPLFSWILSPAEFGELDILTALATLFVLSVPLEIAQATGLFLATEKQAEERRLIASTSLWFSLFCWGVFLVIGALALFVTDAHFFEERMSGASAVLFLSATGAQGMFLCVQGFFRWTLQPLRNLVVSVITGILTVGLAFLGMWLFSMRVNAIILGQFLGYSIGAVTAVWLNRTLLGATLSRRWLREMLTFSLPLVPSSVAVFLVMFLDRFVIEHLLGLSAVGVYGVAYRVAAIAALINVGVTGALTPLIYNHAQDTDTPNRIAALLRGYIIVGAAFVLIMEASAPSIVRLLAGAAYQEAAEITGALAATFFVSSLYVFLPGLALARKGKTIALINVTGAVINLVACYLGVSFWGISGAAFAALSSATLTSFLWWWLGQGFYPLPLTREKFVFALVSLPLTLLVGSVLHLESASIPLAVSVIIGVVGVLGFLFFCRDERLAALKFLRLENLG